MNAKTSVLLVDDHPLVREWLANLINQQADLVVVAEAEGAAQALEVLRSAAPDIAIVDISMEGGSGIELIKAMKAGHPGTRVIVLSMHDEALYAERALRAGARGYIMKSEVTRKVLQAIHAVREGRFFFSDSFAMSMAGRLVADQPETAGSPVERLSDRELEVFQLLGRGYSTRMIAEELHVSFKTVQAFNARIKGKLNLETAGELLREAVRWHDSQQKL